MVNTGKPSPGCYLCRARRVKCDESKPGCLKCKKIGRECPGYRDLNFRFRDETNITIKKAAKDYGKDATGEDAESSSMSSWRVNLQEDQSPKKGHPSRVPREFRRFSAPETTNQYSQPSYGINTPVSEQARNFFLSLYILVPKDKAPRCDYGFVSKILEEGSLDPCFSTTLQAVSLAALATKPAYRSLRSSAEATYVRAVTELRYAVHDAVRAKSNQTLASALLLGLYETLACPSKRIEAYEAHVRGALELVKLRGKDQLDSSEGLAMVVLAKDRYLMLDTLPGAQRDLAQADIPFAEASYMDALGKLGPLVSSQRSLRGYALQVLGGSTKFTSMTMLRDTVSSLLEKCLDLARKFQLITNQGDCAFLPTPVDALDDFPGSSMYSFTSHWVATFYATCQCASLILVNLAIRCLAFLCKYEDYSLTEEYEETQQLAVSAVRNLTASVHYMTDGAVAEDPSRDQQPIPSARIVSFTSVFCNAIASDFATAEQREYMQRRLRYMAEEGGIGQAEALLNVNSCLPRDEIERDKDIWRVYRGAVEQ